MASTTYIVSIATDLSTCLPPLPHLSYSEELCALRISHMRQHVRKSRSLVAQQVQWDLRAKLLAASDCSAVFDAQ